MKPVFMLFVLSLLWGSSFLWIKGLLDVFEPPTVVFFRCFFGLLILLPLVLGMKGKFNWRPGWKFIGSVSLAAAVPWTVLAIALQGIDTTVSGVLNATTPLFAIVFAVFIFKMKTIWSQVVSLILGFLAVVLLLVTSSSSGSGEFSVMHALLMLIVTICYALNSLLVGRNYKDVPSVVLGFWTMFVSLILNGVLSFIVQPMAFVELADLSVLGSVLVLGGLCSGLGYMIFYWITANGGPLVALMVTFMSPFVTITLGVLILDEPLHWGIGAGLFLIVMSLVFMNLETIKARRIAKGF